MLQSYPFLSTHASIKTIFVVGFSLFCHATRPIRTFALRAFLNIIFSRVRVVKEELSLAFSIFTSRFALVGGGVNILALREASEHLRSANMQKCIIIKLTNFKWKILQKISTLQ